MGNEVVYESVKCTGCGRQESLPQGMLTEHGRRTYKCETCREVVLERSVDVKNRGGRKLLID